MSKYFVYGGWHRLQVVGYIKRTSFQRILPWRTENRYYGAKASSESEIISKDVSEQDQDLGARYYDTIIDPVEW